MRGRVAWVVFVLLLAACLGVAFGAYRLAGYSWEQVVGYRSPFLDPSASTAPALSATPAEKPVRLTKRLVLVIVDGMRDDVSREAMPSLDTLRGYGSDLVLTVPQPSLSFPNWTTILTGASQQVSGVTTNWFDRRVSAPTIMDTARAAGLKVGVVGPKDFETLFGVAPGPLVSLRPWPKGGYLTSTLVDDAIRIVKTGQPDLLVVHFPDLDEAGHGSGGASSEYRDTAARIDADLARLVSATASDSVTYLVTADHGHIDSGGHGGWEPVATRVPFVLAGAGASLTKGEGRLTGVAPTVAVLLGIRPPAYAVGTALRSAIATDAPRAFAADDAHHIAFERHYTTVVQGEGLSAEQLQESRTVQGAEALAAGATQRRLDGERDSRRGLGLLIAGAALLVFLLIGVASWRALVAVLVGVVSYYAVYELLFFRVHHFLWSLSAFNTETHVKAFMNGRMVEAIASGLASALIAAAVYPLLRRAPHGARERGYLAGWLTLGPATVLAIQASIAVQIAWYAWRWGFSVTWFIPDLKWGFKTDLDLVQATALGAAAIVAPVVTWLVGRYHPRVRRNAG